MVYLEDGLLILSQKTKMIGWNITNIFNRRYIDSFMVGFPTSWLVFLGVSG